ncbi:hypothetical protein BZL53_10145 [Flavobacterium columnare]|nr:hypothetical protein BZL53_10145 [Flavobacterium columnare]
MATFSLPHWYITSKRRQGFVQKKERYYKTNTHNLKHRNKKVKVLRQSTNQGVKKKRKEYLEAFQKP